MQQLHVMFPDYTSLVVGCYHRKKKANRLERRLIHPTPANLRDECLAVCQQRYLRQDEKTLEHFFGIADSQKAYLAIIEKFDIDKFKPLLKFIKKETNETDPKNIELLAWLIDFNPRPYDYSRKYEVTAKDSEDRTESENVAEEKNENGIVGTVSSVAQTIGPIESSPHKPRRLKVALVIAGILLAAAALTGIFWQKGKKQPVFALTGHESCMYWAEDHFEQLSCSQKIEGVQVIALDSARMHDFKKITQPDTITYNAIGHVWYCKINNKVEFYTSDGNHPIRDDLRLRPITRYMIDKYIRNVAPPE